jgi:hypothetical protein
VIQHQKVHLCQLGQVLRQEVNTVIAEVDFDQLGEMADVRQVPSDYPIVFEKDSD